jgi:UDP-MurNAc hydroxylase
VRILHDPWFTDGIYDGSWFQFPRVPDPIESIGEIDLIYVSHIHPDHYDSVFLKRYFAVYGRKEILAGKMRADKLQPTILQEPRTVGDTVIEILPHRTGSTADIDSAIVLKYRTDDREHCVVNANDIVFDDAIMSAVKKAAGTPDILLCGYTGAGPYPQTYFELNDPELAIRAQEKKQVFFERYKSATAGIGAKVNIPFAGQYLLGGALVTLSPYRGVSDATEILEIDRNAVVLADDGGELSTVDLRTDAVRTRRYPDIDVRRREEEIAGKQMDYERLFCKDEIYQLPIKRLLASAAKRASKESECDSDYFFIIRLPDQELAIINAKRSSAEPIVFAPANASLPEPRSELDIDPRYLFGLLAGIYHWNNAEVGSQYRTRRTPNTFNRKAQSFLTFLKSS